MPVTYDSIATQTVSGNSTSSVVFSSVPQGYTDLVLTIFGTNNGRCRLFFNDSTGTRRSLELGADVSSGMIANANSAEMNLTFMTNNALQYYKVDIMNYSNTNTWTTYICRSGAMNVAGTIRTVTCVGGAWLNTSAVNTVTITNPDTNFTDGLVFALYGILKA